MPGGMRAADLVASLAALNLAAPPSAAASTSALELARIVQHEESTEASAEERRDARQSVKLLAESSEHVRCMCRAITVATSALRSAMDDSVAGWTALRLNLLNVLMQLATSEERCVSLVHSTEAGGELGIASVCLLVLRSEAASVVRISSAAADPAQSERDQPASSSDGATPDAVLVAASLLRNLSLAAACRRVIGELRGEEGTELHALRDLMALVDVRDASTAGQIAACLRLLVEKTPANAVEYVASVHGEAGGAAGGAADGEAGGALAPLLDLKLPTERRVGRAITFARVDFSRFASLLLAACCADGSGLPAEAQRALVTASALQDLAAFLLTTRHKVLHAEAVAALRTSKLPFAADEQGSWPGGAVTVQLEERQVPLHEALARLIASGSLTAEECEGLLR